MKDSRRLLIFCSKTGVLLLFLNFVVLSVFISFLVISRRRNGGTEDGTFFNRDTQATESLEALISKGYHCYGTCYCDVDEDFHTQRRHSSISVSRGLSTLVLAVSLAGAIRTARKRFEDDCKKILGEECSSSSSVYVAVDFDIEDCVSDFDQDQTLMMSGSNDDSRVLEDECRFDDEDVPDHPYDPKTQYKIISWNINGINAFSQKMSKAGSGLTWAEELIARENPTMILLQEIKLSAEKQIPKFSDVFPGYTGHFHISTAKKGYSGTAMFIRNDHKDNLVRDPTFGLGILKHDSEGRTITSEFEDFFVVNNYVPNSGAGLKRLDYRIEEWDADLQDYLLGLEKKKNFIWAGDLNTAILDIDVHNPKTQKSAGFHPRERSSLGNFIKENELVDTFRHLHPDKEHCYSYWGYRFKLREKNKGWRLDYFVVSKGLKEKLVDSYILPDYEGSDHCPVGLIIDK